MGGIKYYQLAKGEELPDEFCAVKDIDGEPSEYTFYVPEVENAKLQETLSDLWELFKENAAIHEYDLSRVDAVRERMQELEVGE